MRNTRTRQRVIEILTQTKSALSHASVYEELKAECDRATVYRILERLVNEGIAHKVVNLDGVTNYALCSKCESFESHKHNHVHFSCTLCQEMTCLEDVEPHIHLPKKYLVEEMNLTVSGVCPNCR
jgi:Fur family ferric uptake transcriptional regulator